MSWLQSNRKIVAPKTTGRRLTSVKSFCKWAGWDCQFEEYRAPSVPSADPHPLPEGIEGVFRLIEATDNIKQKCLIALCGLCGCRVAEALAVRASHFDLHAMRLRIDGKGERRRWVPISTAAWEVLAPSVTRSFIAGDIEVVGLKDRFARRVIKELGEKAGLRREISSHDLRATFGTEVYNRTLDIRVTQELLGHGSVETTQIYTMVSPTKMREAVNFG